MSDAINKPAHYNQGPIECIDAMQQILTSEEFRGFLKGNVFKYLWREKGKNGIEDLRKGKDYYDRLIDSFNESKPEQPAWAPKVGDWVRIKKPGSDKRDSVLWSSFMDEHDKEVVQVKEIKDGAMVHGEWFFPFEWLEPAEQPKPTLNSDKIPEGYRKLKDSSIEPRQRGDLRWSIAEKRYIEIGFDEIGYANRDNWAACRRTTGEATGEVAGEVKPPDGWRWLEVGEVLRKGDTINTMEEIPEVCIGTKCVVKHFAFRRNKFEVGEKVAHVSDYKITPYTIAGYNESLGAYAIKYKEGEYLYHPNKLAPYIEEAT